MRGGGWLLGPSVLVALLSGTGVVDDALIVDGPSSDGIAGGRGRGVHSRGCADRGGGSWSCSSAPGA